MTKLKQITLVLGLVATLLSSCIKENLGDCNIVPVVIKFDYTYNEAYTDLISEVTVIDLYAFDSEGILVGHWSDQGTGFINELTLTIEPGVYHFVAWGGEVNSDSYNVTPYTIGVTTKDELYVMLNRNAGRQLTTKPTNLYHGFLDNYTINYGANEAHISLVKNTKNITFVIHGLDTQLPTSAPVGDAASLDIFETLIIGDNAVHNFDNTFDISSPSEANVTYIPHRRISTATDLTTEFRVMRLALGAAVRANENNTIRLQLKNTLTGVTMQDLNLIEEIIAKHPHIQDNPNEGLVRYSDFLIEISYTNTPDIAIYVTINGWRVRIINTNM